MLQSLSGAIAYFGVVFAAGFVLGVVRVLAIEPHLGEMLAVLIELPVMLVISWIAASSIVCRFSVPRAWAPRITMGAVAFALLMMAELALSVFGFNRSIAEHFAMYRSVSATIGLLGQIAFALFPVVQGCCLPGEGKS